MKQRASDDIWAGLFDFYLVEKTEISESFDDLGISFGNEVLAITNVSEVFTHILTHQRIEARFWHVVVAGNKKINVPDFDAYFIHEIEDLPKPVLINNYLKKYHFLLGNH